MVQCNYCNLRSAVLKRPKTGEKICKDCFFVQFELEVHQTIVANELFRRGERVAIAASGGKDSTVLAHVLTKLNRQHDYGLNLFLLSIDEGITGYRDDSLESVKRNQADYDVPLLIVGYQELYGWSMDAIVEAIGKKNNCTFCGVFRRQALDRGAVLLKADKICTGHNADDMAETVLMNLLRGDIARLQRCTHITTGRGTDSTLPRCKPFKYAYEKEIVMYAYYAGLDYFSTECIYSPNAYRGFARELLKELEAVKPRAIVDIVRSGEHFLAQQEAEEDRVAREPSSASETAASATAASAAASSVDASVRPVPAAAAPSLSRDVSTSSLGSTRSSKGPTPRSKPLPSLGSCERCNYISSNRICKACVLLEGLNKGRAKIALHPTGEQATAAKPVGLYISDGREAESMQGRVATIKTNPTKDAATAASSTASETATASAVDSASPASADAASAAPSAAAPARPPVKLSAAMDMAQKKNATDW